MSTTNLTAELRTHTGHRVKALRKQGFVPATVYGKKVATVSISVAEEAFIQTYAKTGETGLIELVIGTDRRPVLVHMVQRDPLTRRILNIEFHQVDLKEKVTAAIPLKFVGEAPAVQENKGTLLTLTDEVEVEALPTDLPDHLEVDITSLTDVDQEITAAAIKVPATVTLSTAPETALVRIAAPVKEEEAPAPAAAEGAAEGAPTEGAAEPAAATEEAAKE